MAIKFRHIFYLALSDPSNFSLINLYYNNTRPHAFNALAVNNIVCQKVLK